MDIDEDDDFYAPEEPEAPAAQTTPAAAPPTISKLDAGDELEEGEEEDEGGEMDEDEDSDIDIIVESKEAPKAAPPSQSRYSEIRNIPQRSTVTESTAKSAPQKGQQPAQRQDHPPVSTSKIDVNAIPIHKQTGKPLTQVIIDEDLADSDKPWRKPGTDLSDYFNYGFDEFTWALYAQKQEALRGEYNQDAMAQNNKKMLEEFSMMMMGGMVPGMGGAGGAGAGGPAGGAAMAGMEGMTQEAFMQQMMANGMDLSQMDPNTLAAMYVQAGGATAGGQGGQGQNFGAGFGGNQGQGGYGYDQQMAGGGNQGGGGGGGRGGRGRRGRW
ncbi:Fip1 motif-domain-containing protein [Podospora aff. communis PSN243]|uniref:Fip1 motif-domain-containing protein n=1 Tax=Podospora aff. communis PSN243 TaxID=3040156 RepID=A0AAV9GCY7_9PEZI|nr:Fip1 motif-domain-containing protein [Podospora aff. communis PSN243]